MRSTVSLVWQGIALCTFAPEAFLPPASPLLSLYMIGLYDVEKGDVQAVAGWNWANSGDDPLPPVHHSGLGSFLLLFQALGMEMEGNMEGARQVADQFSREFPIISQCRSLVEACMGRMDESKRDQEFFVGNLQQMGLDLRDNIPVVGHITAIVYYAEGKTEEANHIIESATRATVLIAAGVFGGPAASAAAGAAFDGLATVIDSGAHSWDWSRLHGGLANGIKGCADHHGGTGAMTMVTSVGGDALAGVGLKQGAAVAEAEAASAEAASAAASSAAEPKTFNAIVKVVCGRVEYNAFKRTLLDVMPDPSKENLRILFYQLTDMRQTMEGQHLSNSGHVLSRVADANFEITADGFNSRARVEMQVREFESGESSFSSRTQARKDGFTRPSDHPAIPSYLAEKQGCEHILKNRDPRTCAEHQAVKKYVELMRQENPNIKDPIKPDNSLAIMQHRDGTFSTIERCENCHQYDLGKVWTDMKDPGLKVTLQSGPSASRVQRGPGGAEQAHGTQALKRL